MSKRKIFRVLILVSVLLSMLASLAMLAQAAPEPLSSILSEKIDEQNLGTDSTTISDRFSSFPTGNFIGAAQTQTCDTFYFRNQTTNVGADGVRNIANTTAPTSGTATEIEMTTPFLGGYDEIIRFYSDPVLASDMHILGDIISSIWLLADNFENTTFKAELFDYDPGGGATLLDDIEFQLLTDGQNEADLVMTPTPGTVIPAGHRLLVILHAKSPALAAPAVTLFYDSTDRDSRFTVCQLTPPNLTISKNGPAAAVAGQPITYTLTITNSGGLAATNLLISDTLPAGATHVSGGTPAGNDVTWPVASLSPAATIQQSFVVTASVTITNSDYAVTADDNVSATGQEDVVTVVSQPGQPNLTITKSGPTNANEGELITYMLTIANGGDTQAENLIISDTIPVGANYVSGGTKNGNVVTWMVVDPLAPEDSIQVSYAVTASSTITNDDYLVTADSNTSATGQDAVATTVTATPTDLYLPIVVKPGQLTTLFINSVNTGGINPVRILNPGNNNELLTCTIGNNVTQFCGTFSAIGTYKVIVHTNNCGVLQGTFHDATPGATITRSVICN